MKKMDMRDILLTLFMLFWMTSVVWGDEYLSATLIDQKGNSVQISRIQARGTIEGQMGGVAWEYRFPELKRIDNLGNGLFRVTSQEGQTRSLEQVTLRTPGQSNRVIYWVLDKRSGTEKRFSLGLMGFYSIIFSGEAGRLKYNSNTQSYYPPDYIFDPFTGEKLAWKNPEK